MQPLIELKNVSFAYAGRPALEEINLHLHPGQFAAVVGPSGAGKTSLLRILCGLTMPAEGEIRWQGDAIRQLGDEYHREILYLGHLNGVKDDLSALENLHFSSVMSDSESSAEMLEEALRCVGLTDFEWLPAKVLSQGQRRRVALARLVVSKARVWLLDEPFTALDRAAIDTIRSLMEAHLKNDGMVILTTHQEVAIDAPVVSRISLDR